MNNKQILSVINNYKEYVSNILGCASCEADHTKFMCDYGECMQHLLTMFPKMTEMVNDSNKREKLMRWLGFTQGVFWALGEFTLEDLKADNRTSLPDCATTYPNINIKNRDLSKESEQCIKTFFQEPNLEFINPIHHKGTNVTIRLGYKWYNIFNRDKVRKVKIVDAQTKEVIHYANLLKAEIWKFDHVPQEYLNIEHDPDCRTFEGIEKAMRRAYGTEFNPETDVTVLFYDIVDTNIYDKWVKEQNDKVWKELLK